MGQRALRQPPFELLEKLDVENLEEDLRALDPYARYVPPALLKGQSSQASHLGIDIFSYKSNLWIRPYTDGPAQRAGIPEFGELQAINGVEVYGNNLSQISTKLHKALQKKSVVLTVANHSGGKGKAYNVRPAAFQPSSISWRRAGNDTIIRISEFIAHDTAPGLFGIYSTLVRPSTRVVIDLRGCSGGDLFEALEIAGMFVPGGLPLASTYDRSGIVQKYRAPQGKKLTSPAWLLVDERTASAAEIFAGILQYHGLARLVGVRSFGKCESQTLVLLSDGGGLWLTNLGVHFPNDLSCAGIGVEPDIPYPEISVTKTSDVINKLSMESSP